MCDRLSFRVVGVSHVLRLKHYLAFPLILSTQTSNIVFVSLWAYTCRTSCGLAHIVPELSEIPCVRVPSDQRSVSFFWHSEFRATFVCSRVPRCSSHSLDEISIPDFLGRSLHGLTLAVYTPSAVPTICSSLSVALPSQMPWMNRESNLLRSGLLVTDFRINS